MNQLSTLTFNGVALSPITIHDSLWIRSAELAHALGYSREDKISRLYQRNADEFSSCMTQVIEIIAEPRFGTGRNLSDGRCRVFSLRGCHLLAMFARTPVAKAFRRWVLDVLDSVEARRRAPRQADHRPDRCQALRTKVRQIDGHLADIFRHVRRETFAGSHSARPHALAVNAIHTLDNATTALGYVLATMERSAHLAVMAARV